MFLEPRIPEDWVPVTDKKLHDLIQMTGECASFDEDECPIYWDPDTEGYIFLHREAFGADEVMAAYRVARQPNDNQAEVDLSASDDPMARMGQGFCPPFNPHTYQAADGVVCMQGRFHFYEGHPMSHIAAPVRVMKALGVETLLVTNACGGVNLDFQVGDLMVIDDHINFMGANPLTGPNDAGFGPRFCDMTYAYTPALRRLADEVAAAQGVALRHGVYLGYMGPSYETPAEIRAFRVLGADAVGMSTVPEVIAASHCGLPVLAISLVTNMAAGVLEKKLDENEVIETAAARAKVLERLVTGIVERL